MSSRNPNLSFSRTGSSQGLFRAQVTGVGNHTISVKIPELSGHNVYSDVPFYGNKPSVDDEIIVGLLNGDETTPVGVITSGSSSAVQGDIQGVTAGLGLSGGGTSGTVALAFAPSELSSVTVATDDKVVIADTSDSDNPKHVTVSSIAALATASPAGSDHQVQFNNNGSFGADANFTYDGSAVGLGATLTVGVDDTGHDVKFFGATSGKYMEWDQSADQLDVTGSLDVTGNTTMVGTLTIGVDDTGHDVLFHGATAGSYWFWDESLNKMDVSQQATSATLTDFTQAIDKATINVVSDYEADHFSGMIVWTTDDNNSGKPKAGQWVKTTGGGTSMFFGTSATYATGITNEALEIKPSGSLTNTAGTPVFIIADTDDNSGEHDAQCTIHMAGRYHSGTANPLADAFSDVKLISFKDSTDGTGGSGFQIWTSATGSGGLTNRLEIDKAGTVTINGDLTTGSDDITCEILNVTNEIRAGDGSSGDPSYTFTSDSSVGMFYGGTNTLSFSAAAVELTMTATALYPAFNEGLELGKSGHAWNHFWLGQASTFSSGGYYTLRSRDSDRQVMELVSSERFKKDIVDLPLNEAYQVLDARVIKYRASDDDASVPLEVGLSAESLHNAGYEYAVRYDEGHWGTTPRSIYYEYLTAPLIAIIKDLKERIEALES